MSNTLEETLDEILYKAGARKAEPWKSEIKSLILSEAQRIGIEAINVDGKQDYSPKKKNDLGAVVSSSSLNSLRTRQLERLLGLTRGKE